MLFGVLALIASIVLGVLWHAFIMMVWGWTVYMYRVFFISTGILAAILPVLGLYYDYPSIKRTGQSYFYLLLRVIFPLVAIFFIYYLYFFFVVVNLDLLGEEDIWSRFITAVSLYIEDPPFAYEVAIFYIEENPAAYIIPIFGTIYSSFLEVLYFFGFAKTHWITKWVPNTMKIGSIRKRASQRQKPTK